MESNAILLGPDLIREAKNESKCSFIDHPYLLNLGILKSSTHHGIGSRIQTDKDHYFVHLSFQEYFAARYLANAMQANTHDRAIDFIQKQKYNPRFQLVFIFTSGLLVESGEEQSINTFWDTILNKPLDLIGIQHMDLLISCFDEIDCKGTLIHSNRLMDMIIKWIEHVLTIRPKYLRDFLTQTLHSCSTITNEPEVQMALIKLLSDQQSTNLDQVLSFIASIPLTNPISSLLDILMLKIEHTDYDIRLVACDALGKMGEKAATSAVINRLVSALGDEDWKVRRSACDALGKMGEKAATSEVINRLVSELGHEDWKVRSSACDALSKMGEKAATSEVINRLVSALGDEDSSVRSSACDALSKIGEKAATSEVINRLVSALGDEDFGVRSSACDALGEMGEKAATSEVINRLVSAIGHEDLGVRNSACDALVKMGEKAATSEVINRLISALGHEDCKVRRSACAALDKMGEKAATSEVINRLVSALGDDDWRVRSRACEALVKMGEKATTSEVINRLVSALGDEDWKVRINAFDALGKMGEKAATSEVINRLVSGLKHYWFATGIFQWKDKVLKYLSVLSALAVFHDKEIAAADVVVTFKRCIETRSISPQRLLKVYMDTTERIWLPAVVHAFLLNRTAATVFGNRIWVYERERVTEIVISNQELFVELQKGFAEEMGQFHLKIDIDCNLSKNRKLDDAA
jgi:HEAT repeat protein